MHPKSKMKLGIIGSGKVGKALGKALVAHNHRVVFHDIVDKELRPLRKRGYQTTLDFRETLSTDAVFICVPTERRPNGDCNLEILKQVVGKLTDANYSGVVIQTSTCPPLTARKMSRKLAVPYVVCPSFYSMARLDYDALHPVRILIGTKDGSPNHTVSRIFGEFDGPVFYGDYETVELIKYADNVLSAVLISYWNELFLITKRLEKLGYHVDSDRVARAIDLSSPHLRSVYRFHGKAFGGSCLPKDTEAFRNWAAKELGYLPLLVDAAHKVNLHMRKRYGENLKPYIYRS
ncbi:MAG: NAD(P)-binding domain-containing protein [Candidatus Bathyarchaeia archaeon]